MSYKYSVLVAGSGETSRANVEALMEDHYHANGDNGLVVIAFDKRPSTGQIWAAQVASSKNLDVLIISPPDCSFDGVPRSSYIESMTPYKTAIDNLTNGEAFILWSDDDPASMEVLAECKAAGIPAGDLCNGLVEIIPASTLEVEEPVEFPKLEKLVKSETVFVDESEGELENEVEEEDFEDDEEDDPLYSALMILADYIADAVVEKLKDRK